MIVRRARLDDAEPIAEIHVRGWQAAYRGHMPDEFLDRLSVEQRADRRRQSISEPRTGEERNWVLERDGRIIGFAVTGPPRDAELSSGSVAELYAIYLDPDLWGRGLGHGLMDHVLDDLRRRGYRHAVLWVLDANERARSFYERAGWKRDGNSKVEAFGEGQIREVRFRIRLGASRQRRGRLRRSRCVRCVLGRGRRVWRVGVDGRRRKRGIWQHRRRAGRIRLVRRVRR